MTRDMRNWLALTLVPLFAVACTSDAGDDGGGGGGSGSGSGSGSGDLMPPARGFQIKTPEILIHAGEEITYCYYFKTPNTEAMTIKKWASAWTEGSHHMILFFTSSLNMPEGTVSASSGGFAGGGASGIPQWIYSAQNSPSDLAMPADDGAGKPVGMDVAAGQAAFVQLHYNNRGDTDIMASATINAEAYDVGVDTTKTFAYVTYNPDISIPPQSTGTKVSMSCNVPATSNVWLMSTHAHQLAIDTTVKDGTASSTTVVFNSTDWEHPGVKRMENPFYKFTTGKLTTECTYNNPSNNTIVDGDSAATNEMCMASGYIFPATKPTICYKGFNL